MQLINRRKSLKLLAATQLAPELGAGLIPQPGHAAQHFGADFKFGISTSAYQIEGAVHEDGRGPGIWDAYCHGGHHISTGETADIAADHYHHMPQDIALAAGTGIRNYRFSISWPRLFPDASQRLNARGLAFYDRMLDQLLAHGIAPWMCLYHWDLPLHLQVLGGWTSRETAQRLADFAAWAASRFGDRVSHFMVLNEAAVHAMCGHGIGTHAPGLTGKQNWLAALHHLNLGQGLAIQALRAQAPKARIGTVAACEPIHPSSQSPQDIEAANYFDALWNGGVLGPLLQGRYPERLAAEMAPFCGQNDLRICQQKIDLLGINYYSRLYIKHAPDSVLGAYFGSNHDPVKFRAAGWPIAPDGLYEILTRISRDYGAPEMFIAENGYPTTLDHRPGNGLDDTGRITYLSENLRFLQAAIADGAHVTGYFVWTLLDAFEWNAGTKWHFGLVHVDFETLQRTPRDSYYWYGDLVRAHGLHHGTLKI